MYHLCHSFKSFKQPYFATLKARSNVIVSHIAVSAAILLDDALLDVDIGQEDLVLVHHLPTLDEQPVLGALEQGRGTASVTGRGTASVTGRGTTSVTGRGTA